MSTSISRKWRFDRLPGAARRDAHLLVVVTLAAARCEGVAEPVPLLGGERVGYVREGCGSLVGGDHEIGIVAVVAHGVVGRDDPVSVDVVRELKQGAHEDPGSSPCPP
jgi:hypothetical protein